MFQGEGDAKLRREVGGPWRRLASCKVALLLLRTTEPFQSSAPASRSLGARGGAQSRMQAAAPITAKWHRESRGGPPPLGEAPWISRKHGNGGRIRNGLSSCIGGP